MSRSGENIPEGVTFRKVAELWLADVRASVSEATYTRYHRVVEKYLFDTFDEEYVHNIDHFKINAYTEYLLTSGGRRGEGLSPKSVTDILCVLKPIIKFGNSNGYRFGDTYDIRLPKRQKSEVQTIDPDARVLLEQALLIAEDPTAIGILLSLFTGIRVGELCGLRWGDIDPEECTLTISRTVERIANLSEDAMQLTKVIMTDISARVIPLPGFLSEHLEKFRSLDQEYIISASLMPTEPCAFYHRYKAFMRIHGIGDYPFIALRHTFAMRCLEEGFEIETLSEILGHADVATTVALYARKSPELYEIEKKRSAMEKLAPVRTKTKS